MKVSKMRIFIVLPQSPQSTQGAQHCWRELRWRESCLQCTRQCFLDEDQYIWINVLSGFDVFSKNKGKIYIPEILM
jgi:hypothetical protein